MANDPHNVRNDPAPVFLAWGMPTEAPVSVFDEPALWLTGGVTLVLWTVLALVLTTA